MALETLTGPVIAAGEALSDGLDCDGTLFSITMPPEWTPANLTFQLSTDGNVYADLVDVSGNEVMIAVVAGATIGIAPTSHFRAGVRFLKLRSGSRAYPVPQAARREFRLAIEPASPPLELPAFLFSTVPGTNGGTFQPDQIAGAGEVIVMLTGSGAATIGTPAAAEIIAAVPQWEFGGKYRFRLCNPTSGSVTIATGDGVILTGLPDTASNKWREYLVTYLGPDAVEFRDIGSGNE